MPNAALRALLYFFKFSFLPLFALKREGGQKDPTALFRVLTLLHQEVLRNVQHRHGKVSPLVGRHPTICNYCKQVQKRPCLTKIKK